MCVSDIAGAGANFGAKSSPMRYKNAHDYINKLRIIFSGLALLPLLGFGITYFGIQDHGYTAIIPDMPSFWKTVTSVFTIGLSIVAYIQYYQKIKAVRAAGQIRKKLDATYQLNVVKYLLLAVSSFTALVFFILSADMIYAGICTITFVLFAISNPVIGGIINDLRLPKAQRDILRQNIEISDED